MEPNDVYLVIILITAFRIIENVLTGVYESLSRR